MCSTTGVVWCSVEWMMCAAPLEWCGVVWSGVDECSTTGVVWCSVEWSGLVQHHWSGVV